MLKIHSVKASGYGASSIHIHYTHLYGQVLSTPGRIMFPIANYENIFDVVLNKDGSIIVYTYPHNASNLFDKICVPTVSQKLKDYVVCLKSTYPTEESWTLVLTDLGNFFRLVPRDFSLTYPLTSDPYIVLMIKTTDVTRCFPNIYVIHNPTISEVSEILPVMAKTSQNCIPVIGIQTTIGKNLVFLLANSESLGVLQTKAPYLTSIKFPTLEDKVFDGFSASKSMDMFVTDSGAGNLLARKSKKDDVNKEAIDLDKSFKDTLEEILVREIVDKGTVTFSDIMQYGIKKALILFAETEQVIHVNMDVDSVAIKMLIYYGKIYIIPHKGGSYEVILNDVQEDVIICDEESLNIFNSQE